VICTKWVKFTTHWRWCINLIRSKLQQTLDD